MTGEPEGALPAAGVEATLCPEGEAPAAGGAVAVEVDVEIDVVADEAVVELPSLGVLPLDDAGIGVLIVVVVVVTGEAALAVRLAAGDADCKEAESCICF